MCKNYHFIAVGGIGMSGLAKYLLEQGATVSGSDISDSKYVNKLREMGADIHIGHKEDNLPSDSIVVVSTAIKENNPELIKAKREGMLIYHRSDLLEKLSHVKGNFIGYSGTHGKTTTSGLASFLLSKAGLKPSFVVGGIVPSLDTNAEYASEDFFIAELDESDGTIVKYSPDVLVINNLEADHLDFYKNGLSSLLSTFKGYLEKLSSTKFVINIDDDGVKALDLTDYVSYGIDNDADFMAKNIRTENGLTVFDLFKSGEFVTAIKMQFPGKHNIYNVLAVVASLDASNVDILSITPYVSDFTGMGRRLQKVLEFDGVTVYDDYAHHPTEIKATLTALKYANPDKNLIAVFQPHRYTRFKAFWDEFKASFSSADSVVVTDVYSASEDEIEGINSVEFVKGMDNAKHYQGNMLSVAEKLLPTLKSGDIVVGLGAGTITALGKELQKVKEEKLWLAK